MKDATHLRVRVASYAELGPMSQRTVVLPGSEPARAREVIVFQDRTGRPLAYRNLCQHLPIPLNPREGAVQIEWRKGTNFFVCGTHGAKFRVSDGFCVEGPCQGASLVQLPCEVHAGSVYVLCPQ